MERRISLTEDLGHPAQLDEGIGRHGDQREAPPGHLQVVRELFGGDARRLVAHQVFAAEMQQLRVLALRLLAPLVEVRAVGDALGYPRVVERVEVLVPDPYYATYEGLVAASGATFVPVPTTPEDRFHVTAESLENLATAVPAIYLLELPT